MKWFLIFPLLIVLLIGCSKVATPSAGLEPSPNLPTRLSISTPQVQTLTVFAAASLTEAFGEIGTIFQDANPTIEARFNFAGSQTLQAQIESGAPTDLFASANKANMDALVIAGFVDGEAPRLLLTNSLIVVVPLSNPAQVDSIQDLAHPGLKMVLADETVPAGRYARQVLDKASRDPAYGRDFASMALDNVVSNETDIKQVVSKVQLGEADAGIVYISDSIAAPDLKTIPIPQDINVSAPYFIAPVIDSTNLDLANKFIDYVLSADGQAILQKWGFSPVR